MEFLSFSRLPAQGPKVTSTLEGHNTSRALFLRKRGHFLKIKGHFFVLLRNLGGMCPQCPPGSYVYVPADLRYWDCLDSNIQGFDKDSPAVDCNIKADFQSVEFSERAERAEILLFARENVALKLNR